jgi:hypothetical protein
MADTATVTRYRFVPYGGGVEVLDRVAVRDRIRMGDIEAHSELSVVGTEEWHPAASFPELARYFELAASGSRRPGGQNVVTPGTPREVQTMGERLVRGLLYPIDGGQALTLLAIAVASIFPFVGWLANAAATLIMLDIIRKSSEGSTKMPPMVDTSNLGEMVRMYVRVLVVMLIALAPVVAALFWTGVVVATKGGGGPTVLAIMALAAIVAAIYYPACLATVAVWDSVLDALNPVYVFRVISKIGGDYFIVIAAWFVATAGTFFLRFGSFAVLSWVPFVGSILNSMISLWVLFYASHLLGYAVYRHAPELGWE